MSGLTNSAVPETWSVIGRGLDRETGEPFCLVGRSKVGLPDVWRLQLCTNSNGKKDWRVVAMQYSNGEYRTYGRREEIMGRIFTIGATNLSHSKIDTKLRAFAEGR